MNEIEKVNFNPIGDLMAKLCFSGHLDEKITLQEAELKIMLFVNPLLSELSRLRRVEESLREELKNSIEWYEKALDKMQSQIKDLESENRDLRHELNS